MAETHQRKDTFIVRPREKASEMVSNVAKIDVLTLPSGKRVHALERKVFDKAIKDAMKK